MDQSQLSIVARFPPITAHLLPHAGLLLDDGVAGDHAGEEKQGEAEDEPRDVEGFGLTELHHLAVCWGCLHGASL